jgi:hypothetical protein
MSTPTTAQAQAIAAKLQKHLTSRSSKTLPYSVMDLGDIKDVLDFIIQQQKLIEALKRRVPEILHGDQE